MAVILGIDPGSRFTGFGIITTNHNKFAYLTSGIINVSSHVMADRLKNIFLGLQQILTTYQITHAAIESIFVAKNPNSALKLGQARGAVLTALALHQVQLAEYAPRTIKKAVTGSGSAEKIQIQMMIRNLLKLKFMPKEDEADALAVALCHNYQLS